MNKLLFVVFLILPLHLYGAIGDIIGIEIETNGFVAKLTISGLSINGNTTNGLGTNYSPTGTEKLKFNITTPGFVYSNGLVVSNLWSDISYMTTNLVKPYPGTTTNDFVNQSGDVVIRVALSRKINTNETLTATALTGYYVVTNGSQVTNATAFTSQTVTNNSTNIWSKPICGWSNPGFQVVTSSTYQISVVAFSEYAYEGRPVEAVVFWNEDSAGHKSTQTVSRATYAIDGVVEYTANMDASGIDQSSLFTNHFEVYPRFGDLNTVHYSRNFNARGTNAVHNSIVGSCFYICDKNGTYGHSLACVDPVNGVSGGKVITNIHFNAASPPTPFATIGQANNAIAASNNVWYSRNDAGYGDILLTNGIYTWTGTATTGNKPSTWVTVKGWPGVDRSLIIISNQATDANLSEFVKIQDLTVTNSAATFTILDSFWADNVVFNPANPSAQTLNIITNTWLTRCKIQGMLGPNNGSALWKFRACEFAPSATVTYGEQLMLGCYQSFSTPNAISFQIRTPNISPCPVSIYAFNKMLCQTNNNTPQFSFEFPITQYGSDYIGCVFAQNIIEQLRENAAAISVCSGGTSSNLNNFLCHNNTTVGQKVNWFYTWNNTDAGTHTIDVSSSILNCLWEEYNIKSDDYSPFQNGANICNWPMMYGVNSEGNYFPETINVGAPGSFLFRVPGLNTWQQNNGVGTTNTYTKFIDRQAYAVTNDFGNGNYRVDCTSPIFYNIKTRWVLPYDIEGHVRSAIDPPGAYSAGQVKKGAFF